MASILKLEMDTVKIYCDSYKLKTIDLGTRLSGINPTSSVVSYSTELRTEVYCFILNFNILKLGNLLPFRLEKQKLTTFDA